MGFGWALAGLFVLVSVASAQVPQRAGHNFANGQKVEIKVQHDWKPVTIVRREGDWYLVSHERTNWREWAEYWRVRRLRTTTDDLPPIQSHGFVRNNEPPPTAKVAPKPPAGDQLSWASERVKAAQALDAPPAPAAPAAPDATTTPGAPAAPADPAVPAPPAPADTPPARTLELDPKPLPTIRLDPIAPVALPAKLQIALVGPPVETDLERILVAPTSRTLLLGFASPRRGFTPGRAFVERVDLEAGKSIDVTELPAGFKLLDASDEGSVFIIARTGGDDDRLDIYAVTDGKPAPRLGFNPFSTEKWPHNRIQDVRLSADGKHALASNGWSKIVCIDTANGAVLWEKPTRGPEAIMLDPARTRAIFEVDRELVCVSLADGSGVGKFAGAALSSGAVLAPDNSRAFSARGQHLMIQSLNDEPAPAAIDLADPIRSIRPIDRSIVLLNDNLLVDVDRSAILATLSSENAKALTIAPDGSAIYGIAGGRGKVACHPLLDAATRAKLAAVDPSAQVALKRGDTVRVSYDLQCSGEAQQGLRDNAAKALVNAGLKIADAGTLHIIYKSAPGETREVSYRRMHGREQETVQVTEQVTSITIELDGKPIWRGGSSFTGQGFVDIKEGQALGDAINIARERSIIAAGTTTLPDRLLKPAERLSLSELKLPAGKP